MVHRGPHFVPAWAKCCRWICFFGLGRVLNVIRKKNKYGEYIQIVRQNSIPFIYIYMCSHYILLLFTAFHNVCKFVVHYSIETPFPVWQGLND